ncbi:MAG: cation transporter [Epulopiscium sp.]|nr:cation transporter [Candidatus Epulonipiscium sp.]
MTRSEIGHSIGRNTLIVNVILTVVKVIIGIVAKSQGMIADGIHSLSDVISTIVVMLGLRFSDVPEDTDHPYGHEKIEPIVAKLLAVILFVTAIGIGYSGIRTIMKGEFTVPGRAAIGAALLSILVKEWMYQYTKKGAKKIESSALLADAWHHRSDAFSSIGTLIGVLGARMGILVLDPIAALVICVLIGKVAFDIYLQSIHELIDHAAEPHIVEKLHQEISSIDGVKGIDTLKTRVHASKLYVDVDIQVSGSLSVRQGHAIAQKVHDHIEQSDMKVKHCMVHVNPIE